MMTASFFLAKGRRGLVSIARWSPPGFEHLPRYAPLVPGRWFNSVTRAEYEVLYGRQLAALDARQVVADLHQLAGDATPLLLCWERLDRPGQYCHRRMAAAYLERELGLVVPELEPVASGQLTLDW